MLLDENAISILIASLVIINSTLYNVIGEELFGITTA